MTILHNRNRRKVAKRVGCKEIAFDPQFDEVTREALPAYSSPLSRKDFTQHQLFAILVLRQFFKTDYRGVCWLLEDLSDLREVLGLEKVPHYSTLCYAEKRLLK